MRRFLTAEDVHRTQGNEIVVDADTVVTPQAREAAQAAGIVIQAGDGSQNEPTPDRGPDAERSREMLPHLPEPEDDTQPSAAIVTAVGHNRPGVLGELTSAVAKAGGSVNDVSQKVVSGLFHMLLTVELPPGERFEEFKQSLECLSSRNDFVVRVMNERVFRFMHRV